MNRMDYRDQSDGEFVDLVELKHKFFANGGEVETVELIRSVEDDRLVDLKNELRRVLYNHLNR